MDLSPSIPSEPRTLPEGCQTLGRSCEEALLEQRLSPWRRSDHVSNLLVLLAATRTAEHPGISAAALRRNPGVSLHSPMLSCCLRAPVENGAGRCHLCLRGSLLPC